MTGKNLNPHGLVDPKLLHPDGDLCPRCQPPEMRPMVHGARGDRRYRVEKAIADAKDKTKPWPEDGVGDDITTERNE